MSCGTLLVKFSQLHRTAADCSPERSFVRFVVQLGITVEADAVAKYLVIETKVAFMD
jgi:hypothetical protein